MNQATNTMGEVEIHPERQLLEQAQVAAREFAAYSAEQVAKIVEAVATAAAERAGYYAEWAVRETGFGTIEHKTLKNQATSAGLLDFYRGQDFSGYEIDYEKKLVKFARPAGVVLGLAPCTNPVATTNFKTLISLMGRNALILCPHPAAKECSVDAADYLAAAAEAAGAPKNSIQVLREPSIPVVGAMMQSDLINVTLATGGPGMVRAAYSSGNPALGVGPGNPPHYVDETTNIVKAAGEIIFSSSFDCNLLCTSESVALVKDEVADALLDSMAAQGGYLVADPAEAAKLRSYLEGEGPINPGAVGKTAVFIAEKAGIEIPAGTVVLIVELDKVDKTDIIAREKMYPVLGFKRVASVEEALAGAQVMIDFGGKGHSAAIHSSNPDTILAWSSLDVYRIAVNGPAVLVSSGLSSGLNPAATLGTGYYGRSSVGENVGPMHLVNWTQIAYNADPAEVMGDIAGALARREKLRT